MTGEEERGEDREGRETQDVSGCSRVKVTR